MVLPEGYQFTDSQEMSQDEVVDLFRRSGWDVAEHEVKNVHVASDGSGTNVSVGVRSAEAELVGYGGLMLRDSEWAEMGDLMVHPDHRHKGLGRLLIAKRLKIADSLGILEITIEEIENTNPLRNYYEELGFMRIEEQEAFIRILEK